MPRLDSTPAALFALAVGVIAPLTAAYVIQGALIPDLNNPMAFPISGFPFDLEQIWWIIVIPLTILAYITIDGALYLIWQQDDRETSAIVLFMVGIALLVSASYVVDGIIVPNVSLNSFANHYDFPVVTDYYGQLGVWLLWSFLLWPMLVVIGPFFQGIGFYLLWNDE